MVGSVGAVSTGTPGGVDCGESVAGVVVLTMCPDCNGTGWIKIQIPVFADGNWSDVEIGDERCNCNPDPIEPEIVDGVIPDWHDAMDASHYHYANHWRY